MTKIEVEMSEMFEKLDTMKSLKADHELRQDKDKYKNQKIFEAILLKKNFLTLEN